MQIGHWTKKQKIKDHLFAPSTLLSQQALLPWDSPASGEETETGDRTCPPQMALMLQVFSNCHWQRGREIGHTQTLPLSWARRAWWDIGKLCEWVIPKVTCTVEKIHSCHWALTVSLLFLGPSLLAIPRQRGKVLRAFGDHWPGSNPGFSSDLINLSEPQCFHLKNGDDNNWVPSKAHP